MMYKTWMQAQQVKDRMGWDDRKIVQTPDGCMIVETTEQERSEQAARIAARKVQEKTAQAEQNEMIRSLMTQLVDSLDSESGPAARSLAREGQSLLDSMS